MKKLLIGSATGIVLAPSAFLFLSNKGTEPQFKTDRKINDLLKQRHHRGPKQDDDFTVRTLK
ncbi:MAG TPA: hypothetical protein DCP92_21275 [Nitrospiraceae bacterium]|nr:hypothetical protein [Nitrospiraceae bacterium]